MTPDKSTLKKLRDKKITKYQWVPAVLASLLMKKLPPNTEVNYDDLKSAGYEELIRQVDRIYNDKMLIKRLWDEDKKDLTVGPFLLKGLDSPYPSDDDAASIKYIKGKILDTMRSFDPVPVHHRQVLKKVNKFKNNYYSLIGRYPKRKLILEKLGITENQLDNALMYE